MQEKVALAFVTQDMDAFLGSITDEHLSSLDEMVTQLPPGPEAGEQAQAPEASDLPPPRTREELEEMMKDPRYWQDPAYMEQVTQGFKMLSGEAQAEAPAGASSMASGEEKEAGGAL